MCRLGVQWQWLWCEWEGVITTDRERGEYLANTLKYRHHTVYLDTEAADPCQDVG